jgi:serine/threonine protein kinase
MLNQQKQQDRILRKHHTHSTYRLKRRVVHRLALIAGFCCAVQFLRLHVLARSSLEAKYTNTSFADDGKVLDLYDNVLSAFGAANRSDLIAAKSSWQPLGSGCEGNTFAWNDLVVKAFKPKQSTFRNCLPRDLAVRLRSNESEANLHTTRWPTDIPAPLIAGTGQGFLPVKDLFVARSSPGQETQWHLVTPFMEGETLQTLAKSVLQSRSDDELSIRTLDIRFRPRFEELLAALQLLHSRGLCHDDVKPDNIFVANSSSKADGAWLLGDLGNVRKLSHPYHASRLWTHSNGQLPDCRANDGLRAIKTYLQFLRHAVGSSTIATSEFDHALFKTQEPWARLLWRADRTGADLRTESLLQWSIEDDHP